MTENNEYVKCHCGADCDYSDKRYYDFGDYALPCWGEVLPHGVSGDDDFAHLCQGHEGLYWGDPYKPKPIV